MTRKHGIRAPRKPRGEDLAVTIANQDIQIRALIDRIDFLTKREVDLLDQYRSALDDAKDLRLQLACSEAQERRLQTVITRMEGYRDCMREMLSRDLPPFPSMAPGV